MSRAPAGPDYVGRARRYERDVAAGKIPACVWVRLAIARNQRDLERAGTRRFPYVFDAAAASKACRAIERMPHIKGEWARPSFVDGQKVWRTIDLEPWQAWFVTTLFGWVGAGDGLRRFRQAYLSVPRKNAKSTLAAAILNYMLACDGEPGAEVYAGATKKDQARIVWGLARAMALRSIGFTEAYGIRVGKHALTIPETDSTSEAVASDADSLDGLNSHCVVLDELAMHRTRDLYDVMETSLGARLQPLLLLITTAGVNTAGICYELLMYLRKVLEGAAEDETFFGIDYTIDEGDLTRWHDVSVQRKANPNWGVSVRPADMARLTRKALSAGGAVSPMLVKRLNVWVRAEASSGLSASAWGACKAAGVTLDELEGLPCWIGVDLAQVDDMAAVVLVAERADGRIAIVGRYYLPETTIDASPNAQYRGWVREGRLIEVPGQTISFRQIETDILAWVDRFRPREVCLDRALAAYVLQNLEEACEEDPPVVVVPQDRKTIAPAWGEFKRLTLSQGFAHDGDPVLAWMVSNVAVRRFDDGEEFPVKSGGRDSGNKIDGPRAVMNVLARRLSTEGEAADGASEALAERGIECLDA